MDEGNRKEGWVEKETGQDGLTRYKSSGRYHSLRLKPMQKYLKVQRHQQPQDDGSKISEASTDSQ